MRGLWSLTAVLVTVIPWLAAGGNAQETSSPSVQSLITKLPSCALNCIISAVSESDCQLTDLACICSSQSITDASEPCVLSKCSVLEALETQRLQAETCGLPVRSKSEKLAVIHWTFFALAVFFVVLRFLSKLPVWKGVEIWWDDWSMLASILILVGSNVLLERMTENGLGRDIWMLSAGQITAVQKDYWYSAFLYVIAMTGIKISIVLLYMRIFPPQGVPKWFTWSCRSLMVALLASALALCIANATACSPIEYNWLQWDGEHQGHCINEQGLAFSSAAINIFFDLVVFLIPLPMVIPLQISRARKLGACAVFSIGLFVTIASIVRLRYLTTYGNSKNPTWDNTPLAIWSSAEANFAIVSACMPSLARPIKICWRKVRHIVGIYSAGSGSTLIDSRPTTPHGRPRAPVGPDAKGFEQRPYLRPVPSYEDMELVSHPATRQTSY